MEGGRKGEGMREGGRGGGRKGREEGGEGGGREGEREDILSTPTPSPSCPVLTLTTPVQVDDLGVDDPEPLLTDKVQRQRGQLHHVDDEPADYETEHEAQNDHFPPLQPLNNASQHFDSYSRRF